MQKLYILFLLQLFFCYFPTQAHLRIDSIGVENSNGKKVILHKVEAKETYYSLGRKYNVAAKDIISYNDNKFLSIGVVIKVPTQRPFTANNATATVSTGVTSEHTVKAKENLNVIAGLYNTTVFAIKQANGMTSNNLSIGQVLKIPVQSETAVTQTQQPVVPIQPVATPANQHIIEHTVKAKEFLNMLAERYGTTVDDIKRLNNLTSNGLSIGQVLKIPATAGIQQAPVINTNVPAPVTQTQQHKHTVVAGETIFSIAQKYSLTAFQIREANNITSNSISIGQVLTIPVPPQPLSVAETARNENTSDTTTTIRDPALRRDPSVYGLNKVEEKGTAVWISDPDLDATKMLILHRTLPVGSVIKITNPMRNISTLAKVVGKFTENETTKDVIIVCTKAVADVLGVLDKRFFCNLTYAIQENEQ